MQKDDYDADQNNPFVSSLREEATDPDIAAITGFSRSEVDYRVCRADALKRAGGDERLAAVILDGWAQLHNMPAELLEEEAAEGWVVWLRKIADERDAAMAARMAEMAELDLEDLDDGSAS